MPAKGRTRALGLAVAAGGEVGAAPEPPPPAARSTPQRVRIASSLRNEEEEFEVRWPDPDRDEAEVVSRRGVTYRTTDEGCTCMDQRVRGGICRHMAARWSARDGQPRATVLDGTPAGESDRPGWVAAYRERQEELARRRAEEERARELARELWDRFLQESPEEGPSLADDETYRAMSELARRPDAVPYEVENVLDGSPNTFGVEIEFEGGNADRIAQILHQEGLCAFPRRMGYHSERVAGKWTLERDTTVSSGTAGGELVSPVFTDTAEAWREIERVCQVLRENGARATARCGAHVHIGAGPLDHRVAQFLNLARTVAGYEDVIFRMASAGTGRHRGAGRGFIYSSPLRRALRSTYESIQSLASHVGGSHYDALNLSRVGGRSSTIELRHFDGTVDPRQIQANIRIASALVDAAQRLPPEQVPAQPTPLGTHRGRPDPEDRQVRELCDRLFRRGIDKLRALWLYHSSQWQPGA